ncbi:branched-chain amino acid transport system II carrier protein [Sansalvadorimonas verongulae]|uniref:branched-chain amino acid transport system II carrier protein n=1 Tax=Sansalvadorimonas verongulae TaxID=2172824 RepID=UPI0012BC72A1|nr:branched-chain amino acid transport system II carrier protein [Sansalvadorimonas verongulae]MTI14885.1 branched-chain amino acid transport system II carrier protein [Sansalvadorimonas verongulae]
MRRSDLLGLGLMVFAFFLGAGNLIFPPWAGQLSGENLWLSLAGFLATDVGLSLLAIIAIAMAGSVENLTRDIPAPLALTFWVTAFIIIGPAFAVPRTSVVAYEVGILPWVGQDSQLYLAIYSLIFFAAVGWLCLNPGQLITIVGKILTPILAIVLGAICMAMIFEPPVVFGAGRGPWAEHAMLEGAIQGYLTMDTLGALAFGIVIAASVRRFNITDKKSVVKYTIQASLIAGLGLSLVYLGLFYLGGISRDIVPDARNGGHILSEMVIHLLGGGGQFALSAVITLACITTAVGVTTSFGDHFHHRWPNVGYRFWVVLVSLLSMLVANAGLNTLLKVSIPVVVAIYPVAIIIIFVEILRQKVVITSRCMRVALAVVFAFSCLDGLSAAEVLGADSFVHSIPLFDNGLGWLVPGLAVIVGGWLVRLSGALSNKENV